MDGDRQDLSSSHNAGAINSDEMRNMLYERLHNKGLLDSLKSQLRNYMISELHGKTPRKGSSHKKVNSSLQKKVVDSLVFKYLCENGFDYSAGVFLPEVEMSQREVLSGDELTHLLHLSPAAMQSATDKSLLQVLIVEQLQDSLAVKSDESTQTDHEPLQLLADKLSSIDLEFSTRSNAADGTGSLNERLASYQRKVEEAASEKYQQQFERWKQLEMDVIRLKEREKQDSELQEKRKLLEEEYRKKISAVTERERSLTDSVKLEFESVQRETYQQRQQLLQQSENLRQRELELREQKEHMARLQRMNEEKVEKLEQMVKKRESDVNQRELRLDGTLRSQIERCRMEEKLAYDSKYRELKALEDKVKDKEASVERDRLNLLSSTERSELVELRQQRNEMEAESRRCNLEVASLEMKASGLQERLAKMFDYEVLKESNIALKKDLELIKDRLNSLMREHSMLQEKHEQALLDGREKAGLSEIMMIKTQIQKERDRALDDKVLLEHKIKELEAQHSKQLQKNQALVREFELQTNRQKSMNKEYGELRRQLHHTDRSQGLKSSPQKQSLIKEQSYYDTSLRRTLPPELALDADWSADGSSVAEVSSATEDSIVTETRKRLSYLTRETENLQSAFQSLTRRSPPKHVGCPQTATYQMRTSQALAPLTSAMSHHSIDAVTEPRSGNVFPHLDDRDVDPVLAQSTPPVYHTAGVSYLPSPAQNVRERGQSSTINGPLTLSDVNGERSFPALSVHQADRVEDIEPTETLSQAEQFNRPTPNKADELLANQNTRISTDSLRNIPSLPPAAGPSLQKQQGTSLADKWQLTADTTDQKITEQPSNSTAFADAGNLPASLDSQWGSQAQMLDSQWKSRAQPQALQTNYDAGSSGSQAQMSPPDQKKDEMAGIDPVMQKYMKMIQQQKDQTEAPAEKPAAEKTQPLTAADAEEASISDHVSLVKSDGAATDEDFW